MGQRTNTKMPQPKEDDLPATQMPKTEQTRFIKNVP